MTKQLEQIRILVTTLIPNEDLSNIRMSFEQLLIALAHQYIDVRMRIFGMQFLQHSCCQNDITDEGCLYDQDISQVSLGGYIILS